MLPGSCFEKYYFREYLGEKKRFPKILKGVNLGSRYYGFMKKTRLRKSHATVPVRAVADINLIANWLSDVVYIPWSRTKI